MSSSPYPGHTHYAAPETLQGGEVTILSDLWSLGCTFYEMFTGNIPSLLFYLKNELLMVETKCSLNFIYFSFLFVYVII